MKYVMECASSLFKTFQAYQQKRADYMLLQSLSDRELRDLGIGRGSIREAIERHHADS